MLQPCSAQPQLSVVQPELSAAQQNLSAVQQNMVGALVTSSHRVGPSKDTNGTRVPNSGRPWVARSGDQSVSSSSTHAMPKLFYRVMTQKTTKTTKTIDDENDDEFDKSAKNDFINEERGVDNSIGEETTTNNKFDEESIKNGKIEEESVRRKRVDEDAVKKDEGSEVCHVKATVQSKNPLMQRSQSGGCTETASVQTISADAEPAEYKNWSFIE